MNAAAAGAPDATTRPALLRAEAISKSFSGVAVLHEVNLDLTAGEVHAVMGENGAGKSTLVKILAGVHTDYEGIVTIGGERRQFLGVRDAEKAGIALIHQELNLVPELSVAANIFLGREPLIGGIVVNRRAIAEGARDLLRRVGITIDPSAKVGTLRVGEQQLVEIAKALSLDARILIMDEPTSALSPTECRVLFTVVRQLASSGVAIVYISHRIDEVMRLADRVTVLRDGRLVVTAPIGDLTRDKIIRAMVGRELAGQTAPERSTRSEIVLSVRDLALQVASRQGRRKVVDGVSFDVHEGEILGIGGLLGAGRTEILEAIFGAADGVRSGEIRLGGVPVEIASPIDARRLGLALVTEDRKAKGLLLGSSIRANVALPSLWVLSRFGLRAFAREVALARGQIAALGVRCTGIEQRAGTLSGGNQQKVVIGKWLATRPRVLLLDEPTRGIDVGAKREIYDLVFALAADGLSIIVISSEMPELLLLSDRILVMCEGRQTGLLTRAEATQEEIMRLAAPAAREAVA